jgi:hypothetical protein
MLVSYDAYAMRACDCGNISVSESDEPLIRSIATLLIQIHLKVEVFVMCIHRCNNTVFW